MLKISLQTKIFILMVFVLLGAMGSLSALSIQFLRQEKKSALFEVHRSELRRMSSEIKSRLLKIEELTQKLGRFEPTPQSEFLISLEYNMSERKLSAISVNSEKLQMYHLSQAEVLKQLNTQKAELFAKQSAGGLETVPIASKDSNSNSSNQWLGFRRVVENQEGRPVKILLVIFDSQELKRIFDSFSMGRLLLLNHSGQAILANGSLPQQVSSKPSDDLEDQNLLKATQTLYEIADTQTSQNSTLEFISQSQKYFGGFEKLGEKIFLVSVLSEEKAMLGVAHLSERIVMVTSITLTIAFMISVLFAKSLTEPLNVLVSRMKQAGTGDFLSPIHVKTADEIRDLADGFKDMMREIKDSRDQLEETNRNLESKVKERTLELERQNLIVKEAQEALLKTTRLASAGEVAGRAAHEVLNPLTSLLARVDVFEQRALNEKRDIAHFLKEMVTAWKEDFSAGGFANLQKVWSQPSQVSSGKCLFEEDIANLETVTQSFENSTVTTQGDLEFIRNEGKRIIKIVNGMRKLSQPQSDRRLHSLHSILKEAKIIMNDLFFKRGFQIQLNLSASSDSVEIDRDEFLQVLTNMMRNSLQALNEANSGSGLLKITTENQLQEGQNLIFVFLADNGGGISEENQRKLFEKQFTTKNSEEGTGLGLSISRRLVRANGGDIEFVRSTARRETVFLIKFPVSKSGQIERSGDSDEVADLQKYSSKNKGAVA